MRVSIYTSHQCAYAILENMLFLSRDWLISSEACAVYKKHTRVGVIVCAIVLVANVLSVVKATAAIDEIERVDTKVKTQTYFIKSLPVDVSIKGFL